MRQVLFVENRCSFSWNVVDTLPVSREQVRICRAAEAASQLDEAHLLVLGPGPTDPLRAGLVDLVRVAAERRLPVLGVCLGHQAIGLAFGADLARGQPVHGKVSRIELAPSRLMPGFQGSYEVMRYHSLRVENLPLSLHALARSSDGALMAVEHKELPMLGLQFHPDSYVTPASAKMSSAFFRVGSS